MSYLHIAEKNSIAKEVAQVLSNGSKRTGNTISKFNPVFHFTLEGHEHTFSSVRGHLFTNELPQECKSWANFDNKKILTREVEMLKTIGNDMQDLMKNLQNLARGKKELILWLDCDRQGEAIAFEVIEVVARINPRITIRRARFAAVTRQDVLHAYHHLVNPNKLEADAVNYRIEIDFRMGCAFTRYQTTTFSKRFHFKQHSVLSYGPCQIPTLGFVVQRYLEIKYFKPEKYWVISAAIILDQKTRVELKWERKSTKNEEQANISFCRMYLEAGGETNGHVQGSVQQRNKNEKKKYRPYPLTTVKFQKLATDRLRMSSANAMKIAEKLYMNGFISYPRTETNSFPETMDVQNLVKRLQNCSSYADYITKLMNLGKYLKPKVGKQNDQAHAPIHPVKPAERSSLTQQQWKVYDLITRHFLACCSKDAVGVQSQLVVKIGAEVFKANHLAIKEKNYLQVYPFQRWIQSEFPGEIPEVFSAAVELKQSKTQPPGYLSESDLITLMQKNQIGTDSTIHEHIETIQNRKYAIKSNNTFKPTNLGASLIITYKSLGIKLEDCHIRRLIEQRMNMIAEGTIDKEVATWRTLQQVTPIYEQLKAKEAEWLNEMGSAMAQHESDLKKIEIQTQNERIQRLHESSEEGIENQQISQYICFVCRKPGHTITNCPDRNKKGRSIDNSNIYNSNNLNGGRGNSRASNQPQNVQQSNHCHQLNTNRNNNRSAFCYACKQPGHVATDCPLKQKSNHNITANTNLNNDREDKNKDRRYTCFKCGKQGHFAPECPDRNIEDNTNVSSSVCYLCKRPGHLASRCPQRGGRQGIQRPNNGNKVEKNKKVCQICGGQGRHPKGSKCEGVKRHKKSILSAQQHQSYFD